MKPLSPIDIIDSGADDNEPVKGVTHGHLRRWHDMFEDQSALIWKLTNECIAWSLVSSRRESKSTHPVCQKCKAPLAISLIMGAHGLCEKCVSGGFKRVPTVTSHQSETPDDTIVGQLRDPS